MATAVVSTHSEVVEPGASTSPTPTPAPDHDVSIWWLETNSMISSMGVDQQTTQAYLNEMQAQSETVNSMTQQLAALSQKIQTQADQDRSIDPSKMMGCILGVVVGCLVLGALTGGTCLAAGLTVMGTVVSGAVVGAAAGALTAGVILGSVLGAAAHDPNEVKGLTDQAINPSHLAEDQVNQQLFNMIGSNATQQENLAQQLGPTAQTQKQETWANIIDSVTHAAQTTNTMGRI